MLTFFRKYQKVFFLFTAVTVITSFIFWGAMGAMGSGRESQEVPLVRSLSGSMLTQQKVEKMISFLSSSQLDLADDKISSINLLNDGVMEKDFFSTAQAGLLAKVVFPQIRKEMVEILSKARSFHAYRHPGSAFLSADALWSQFSPDSVRLSQEIMRMMEVTPRTVELLGRFYVQQKSIPFSFLRKIFSYQESQDAKIKPDPTLAYADLSLLGLHSMKEFFGDTYLKAAALVILNGAARAQEMGFSFSIAEARQQLMHNIDQAAKRMGQDLASQDVYPVFLRQVRNLGMEEAECLSLWKDIALYRKLVSSFSAQISLEPQELLGTMKEQAEIELFSQPKSLQLQDFSDLLQFQIYIEAIAEKGEDLLALPKNILSVVEIAKKHPELVQRDYVIDYIAADIQKLALAIPLKEMWAWQKSDQGWSILQKQFSSLKEKKGLQAEDRLSILDRLEEKFRLEIDAFSRETILSSQQERLQKMIGAISWESSAFSVNGKGIGLPFSDIKDQEGLLSLLEVAALDGEVNASEVALAAKKKLQMYSQDQKHYYVIHIQQRALNRQLMTFKQAKEKGVLQKILDKKLENLYSELRKKDGSLKPLSAIRDQVGLALFPNLCKAIVAEYSSFYGKEPSKEEKADPGFYVQYRMLSYLRSALSSVPKEGLQPVLDPIVQQWALVSENICVAKEQKEFFPQQEQFYLQEESFSPPIVTKDGKAMFFRMLGRSQVQKMSTEEKEAILAPKKAEAEKLQMTKFLQEMQTKKAFCLESSL